MALAATAARIVVPFAVVAPARWLKSRHRLDLRKERSGGLLRSISNPWREDQ
ncbi:hypothetical protein BT69DRAFT_1329784 [Atractiella rhizophila]|nr:hypothetical protein BT69DRAFT_1329784 [Atractiella rhizophila]